MRTFYHIPTLKLPTSSRLHSHTYSNSDNTDVSMSYYNHRVRLLASLSKSFTTWQFSNMSCQSYLELHCWRLRLRIQWHLQQPTPSAHSHSCQSSCTAVSVCLCTGGKQKELWGKKMWFCLRESKGDTGGGLNSPADDSYPDKLKSYRRIVSNVASVFFFISPIYAHF